MRSWIALQVLQRRPRLLPRQSCGADEGRLIRSEGTMSLNGKRVVVTIPYGRRRTVSILMSYLRRDRAIVDEVQLWINTDEDQVEDREWAYQQQETYGGWVRCVELPERYERRKPKQLNTGYFYALCT